MCLRFGWHVHMNEATRRSAGQAQDRQILSTGAQMCSQQRRASSKFEPKPAAATVAAVMHLMDLLELSCRERAGIQ